MNYFTPNINTNRWKQWPASLRPPPRVAHASTPGPIYLYCYCKGTSGFLDHTDNTAFPALAVWHFFGSPTASFKPSPIPDPPHPRSSSSVEMGQSLRKLEVGWTLNMAVEKWSISTLLSLHSLPSNATIFLASLRHDITEMPLKISPS